jgi:hypothetical protein
MAKRYPSDEKAYVTWYKQRVTIPQSRIDAATRQDSANCMVSEELPLQLPVIRVITDGRTIRMTHKVTGVRYVFLTPQAVIQYIADWDEGRDIKPFSFRLGNPTQIVKPKPKVEKPHVKSLNVTNASSKEVKAAIRKGTSLTGQTLMNHSPTRMDRAPVVVGGALPPLQTVFGPKRRYGFRALARRYGDVEAKAREEGRLQGLAEAEAKAKTKRIRK